MPPANILPPSLLTVDRVRFALPAKEYVSQVTRKDLVILHFTAGRSAESAFHAWKNDPARVATAYLVDADGSIYETFDPKYWAFHLGIKGTSAHDARSIGIEIANVGPLKRSLHNPQVLHWWPKEWQTPFCTLDERDKYVECQYRGMQYFAAFPGIQMNSIRDLVHHLCERFDIPRRVCKSELRSKCDMNYFSKHTGIATHANFRQDKWDIGPAYDWDSLAL